MRSLHIDGAKRISEDDIKRRLATGEPGALPWSAARPFDPVQWEEDLRRIQRLYEARGFYGSRVVASEIERRGDGVHLRVRVEESEPTILAGVEVLGLETLPPDAARHARAAVRLRPGHVFLEGEWSLTKSGIERALRDDGYADAAVGGEARVDVAARRADARLEIAPGRRYRFGEVLLATEREPAFPPSSILAHARALLPRDAWFSQRALEAAQRRLFDLGVFEAVAVTAAAAEPGADRLPIVIGVREAPPISARIGGGIGTNPGRSEARAVGEWTYRGLGGDLRVLRLGARAGWAFVPGAWDALRGDRGDTPTRQGPFAKLAADLAQPSVLGSRTIEPFASTELEQELREAYEYRSARVEVGAGWRASDLFDVRASWALDLYDLYDSPLLGRSAPEQAAGCPAPCRQGYLELEVTAGRRRGYREGAPGRELTVRLRQGAPFLGGAAPWFSGDGEGILHVPLSSRVALAGRLRAAAIVPLDAQPIPIVLRLFSGGGSMRGFGARRLSPLLVVPGPHGSTQVVPTGGRALADGSVEVRVSVGQSFEIAAFTDIGAVTSRSFDPALLWRALRVAPGIGVRYRTPLGPLRADLAWPLPDRDLELFELPGTTVDRAAGQRGGHACCAMHSSFGESF
ncbi:MAG TPA: BamA/TamA family outer membrane protein [Anaeromyxobacteraceae bacterium]|nr:BamA/TamA family outer membrane protein [Anaeromyxobacteraceae bacterium]